MSLDQQFHDQISEAKGYQALESTIVRIRETLPHEILDDYDIDIAKNHYFIYNEIDKNLSEINGSLNKINQSIHRRTKFLNQTYGGPIPLLSKPWIANFNDLPETLILPIESESKSAEYIYKNDSKSYNKSSKDGYDDYRSEQKSCK